MRRLLIGNQLPSSSRSPAKHVTETPPLVRALHMLTTAWGAPPNRREMTGVTCRTLIGPAVWPCATLTTRGLS